MSTGGSSIPEIEIESRSDTGKRANVRLRAAGHIPAVVYHRGEETVTAAVATKDFIKKASAARSSQIFSFKSKDGRLNGKTVLVKEIARDYISDAVLHVDFQSLKEDEEIVVRVPLKITGEAYGVKNENGILTVSIHDIGVRCLPRQIPTEFVIDVAELHLGMSIHAGAIPLPTGVVLADDAEETVVSVVAIRVVEEAPAAAEVTDEAAAAAAAAGGAAAPGAAPAAAAGAQPAAASAAGDKKKDKK